MRFLDFLEILEFLPICEGYEDYEVRGHDMLFMAVKWRVPEAKRNWLEPKAAEVNTIGNHLDSSVNFQIWRGLGTNR